MPKFLPPTQEELERRKVGAPAPAPAKPSKPRRARVPKGQFAADDPSTPDVNNAFEKEE